MALFLTKKKNFQLFHSSFIIIANTNKCHRDFVVSRVKSREKLLES